MTSQTDVGLAELGALVREGRVSPIDLVDQASERIAALDPSLNAFVRHDIDRARRDAIRAAAEIADGRWRGPLHGVPMALKDLYDVAGLPTTASSARVPTPAAAVDSALAARLFGAGAILMGKTHTHEFAYGLTTPQTHNAVADDRVAGGSSGGSAVAVATGMASYALGTDTGGSTRVPAALNGVVGFKPGFGRLSLEGVQPLAASLDHAGLIARTVADVQIVFDVLAGGPPDVAAATTPPTYRVGILRRRADERLAPAVRRALDRTGEVLVEGGVQLDEVDVPLEELVLATQYALLAPEATAEHLPFLHERAGDYGEDVAALLYAGATVPAVDYLRALDVRRAMRRQWTTLLDDVDAVLLPTTPVTAVRHEQREVNWPGGVAEPVADAYVRTGAAANITGLPALSLPAGVDDDGLPVGVQIVGRSDESVLGLGAEIERGLRARTQAETAR